MRDRISRALISVSDKTGIADLARALAGRGIELISTGGTAAALRAAGLTVLDVSAITGFPEIMDGRVKTLHPAIHGALLGRRDIDAAVMAKHGIEPIDLVVINLYPFEATVARAGCTREEAIENIDIGGPAMIRAAAKNHAFVAVVVDPSDYAGIIDEFGASGTTISEATRRRLARKAYAHTASYDAAIWSYLNDTEGDGELPERLPVALRKQADLRYGEITSARHCTGSPAPTPARYLKRASTRASRCPSITSPTPMRRWSASGRCQPRHASSSSTPIPAAWGSRRACQGATRRPTRATRNPRSAA